MRHGSLFSGIGGFDLAAEWMEWENIFHCEWMPFPRQILHYHFPKSISYEDITKTNFTIHRGSIDILTGGFPCQPYSSAGKRLGKEDERHLWPEMLRAIQEIEPTYIVGENVRGLTNWNGGVVFEEVCVDLENCGYEVQPILLPACAVGAPHRRDRIWFVAKNTNEIRWRSFIGKEESNIREFGNVSSRDNERVSSDNGEIRTTTNTTSKRSWEQSSKNCEWENRRFNNDGEISDATNTSNERCKQRGISREIQNSQGISENKRSEFGISIKTMGYGYKSKWENFPTQSPICGGDDGLSTQLDGITFSKWRAESIKGYGNAIVPQVAYEIFKVIEKMNYDTIQR